MRRLSTSFSQVSFNTRRDRAVAGDLGHDHVKILVDNVAVDQRIIGDDRLARDFTLCSSAFNPSGVMRRIASSMQ